MRALGFTLLEVLIALAIVSIGVLATLRAVGMVTTSVDELRNRQLADWAAQNRLAELRAQGLFPGIGVNAREVTQGGQRFRVREEIKTTPNPLFRRVDIRVFANGGEHAVSQLTGFVVQPLR